jgi:choline kinase
VRAVLLAAGRANRLRPLTDATPKCLLEVGGRSIVSRALGALREHGIRRFTVVDGFQGDRLRAALLAEFPADSVTFVRNEQWETTNNSFSLWLARSEPPEPMLLLDSDIVFDPGVIGRLLADGPPNRLALRTRGDLGDEEVKVTLAPDGRIADIAKTIAPALAAGESVGIELFSADFVRDLFVTLERRMLVERRVNEWYEASFVELIEKGAAIHPVDLGELRCMEIDTVEDLERARRVFA